MEFFELSSEELVLLSALLAKSICRNLNQEQIDVLSWFLGSLSYNVVIYNVKNESITKEDEAISEESEYN